LHTATLVQAQYLRVFGRRLEILQNEVDSTNSWYDATPKSWGKIVYQTRYLCPSLVCVSKAGAYLKWTISKLTTKSPKFKTWTRIFAFNRNKLMYHQKDRLKHLSQLKASVFFSKQTKQLIPKTDSATRPLLTISNAAC
jgi:hypothetical protein